MRSGNAPIYSTPFGNILESTGNVNNNITYAGYQYDEETGLYYLNARMYDPKIARFLQEDTYRGDPNDPLSLNLYAYTANNPITYYDPTGHYYVFGMHVSEYWEQQRQMQKRNSSRQGMPSDLWNKVSVSNNAANSNSKKNDDTNLMQSNIQFNPDTFSQPGSIMSINSGLIQIGAETGRIYIPRAIENTVKPNNIGTGTWNRYVSLESKTAVSKFTKVSRVAKYAGWASVGVDAGFGVYENIQEGAPTKKIVSDATVDVGFGAGGLLTSMGTGALLGSFGVPVIGTVIGGAAAGIVYVVTTEVWEPGGKSIKNRTKDELYDRIR